MNLSSPDLSSSSQTWQTVGHRLLDAHQKALEKARQVLNPQAQEKARIFKDEQTTKLLERSVKRWENEGGSLFPIRESKSPVEKAAAMILSSKGKTILTGVGKSGQIAQKIASSLCSTGTPALFLNAAEALHGDLGVISKEDVVVMLSNSGSTLDLIKMIPQLKRQHVGLIGILGRSPSPLADQMDIVLDSGVENEGDPHNLAPMASALCTLAIGDTLTAILMVARNFTPDDYSLLHPGGQLGRNLLLTVEEVMHKGSNLPHVFEHATIREVVIEMTRPNLGIVCILDGSENLLGILTDGDIRRFLTKSSDLSTEAAKIMTQKPLTIFPDQRLGEALTLMENKKVYVIPVVSTEGKCLGILRMHDILTR